MTILEKTPIPMAEAHEIVKKLDEKKELKDYFKKFTKLKKDKAEALIKELNGLNNMKLREDNLVKIADFLPKDGEELNKLFQEVSLSEDEANKIVEIVKKY